MPMPADQAVSASPDFFGFERAQCDLPYYRGGAGGFGLTSVFVVFCATAGAFAVLMKAQQSFHSGQMVICGNVSVPIDHRRPDSDRITIAFNPCKAHALSPEAGPDCAEAYPDITARTLPSTGC